MNAKNSLPAGIKKTRQREYVLSVLENAQKPLSAPEIYASASKYDDGAWMSTIYRILDLLVKKGTVSKINRIGNDMALYELNRSTHRHYAICLVCNKVIDMDDDCPLRDYMPTLSDKDFKITGHNLELYGYCKNCK